MFCEDRLKLRMLKKLPTKEFYVEVAKDLVAFHEFQNLTLKVNSVSFLKILLENGSKT